MRKCQDRCLAANPNHCYRSCSPLLLLALLISLLTLLDSVQHVSGDNNKNVDEQIGFGKHKITNELVTVLAKGSRVSKEKDISGYTGKGESCEVSFKGDDIRVHYRKGGESREKGCFVDLLTTESGASMLKFTAGVTDKNELGKYKEGCLYQDKNGKPSKSSGFNLLPFAYSSNLREIETLKQGPHTGGECPNQGECVKRNGKCMIHSTLEVGFGVDDEILNYISIAGEPEQWSCHSEVPIASTEASFGVELSAKGDLFKGVGKQLNCKGKGLEPSQTSPVCFPIDKVPKPKAFRIVDKPDSSFDYLVSIYFLPQSSVRRHDDPGKVDSAEVKPKDSDKICEDMYLEFPSSTYKLLLVPGGRGEKDPVTGTGDASSTTTVATTAAEEGLGMGLIVGIAVGIIVVVVIIGVLVWFLVLRGKGGEEGEGAEGGATAATKAGTTAGGATATKTKGGATTVGATQAKTMGTTMGGTTAGGASKAGTKAGATAAGTKAGGATTKGGGATTAGGGTKAGGGTTKK